MFCFFQHSHKYRTENEEMSSTRPTNFLYYYYCSNEVIRWPRSSSSVVGFAGKAFCVFALPQFPYAIPILLPNRQRSTRFFYFRLPLFFCTRPDPIAATSVCSINHSWKNKTPIFFGTSKLKANNYGWWIFSSVCCCCFFVIIIFFFFVFFFRFGPFHFLCAFVFSRVSTSILLFNGCSPSICLFPTPHRQWVLATATRERTKRTDSGKIIRIKYGVCDSSALRSHNQLLFSPIPFHFDFPKHQFTISNSKQQSTQRTDTGEYIFSTIFIFFVLSEEPRACYNDEDMQPLIE